MLCKTMGLWEVHFTYTLPKFDVNDDDDYVGFLAALQWCNSTFNSWMLLNKEFLLVYHLQVSSKAGAQLAHN